jgi:hypothetical protein
MAIKTFTTGEVLTASDTNTYLANAGLVFVKSQTVGATVSSVTVSDAFNSTYDNYRIILAGGVGSTSLSISMTLGSTAANYYGSVLFANYGGGGAQAVSANAETNMRYIGGADTSFLQVNVDVCAPNLAKATTAGGTFQNNTAFGSCSYRLADSTQYTAFTLTCDSGTITGGTITVYGYRKA